MVEKGLKEIVELTPDYQNVDMDFSFYDRLANRKDENRPAINLAWNDFVDSSIMLHEYLQKNHEAAEKYGNKIEIIVNNIYGDNLNRESIAQMIDLVKSEVTRYNLSSISEEADDLPEYFHGTGSSAIEGILNKNALISEKDLRAEGVDVSTGEGYLNRKSWNHSFVSLTRDPARAIDHHAYVGGISTIDDFPVVFGLDREKVESGRSTEDVYTFHMDMEPQEVCVKGDVSLDAVTHVYAPISRKGDVENLGWKRELKFIPIESLQKRCGLDFDVFYCDAY